MKNSGDDILLKIRGQQLTLPFLHSNGFTQPIFIPNKDGLDLNVPPDTFTVHEIEELVGESLISLSNFSAFNHSVAFILGSDRLLDVIDVTRQADVRMTMREFVEYYENPNRTKIFNVISLEFSETRYVCLQLFRVLLNRR